jgi:hypothetical protein
MVAFHPDYKSKVGKDAIFLYWSELLGLRHVVLWTIATLWYGPINVLSRNLDVTGLAVNAVL